MYQDELAHEKKNKKVGMRNSIILHLLLLLIAFFYSFSVDNKYKDPEKPYRVYVDIDFKPSSLSTYAHADVGKARPKTDQPKATEEAKVEEVKTTPTPVETPKVPTTTPTPTPPVPTSQTTTKDDSPVRVQQSDVKFDDPVPDKVPVKTTPTPTETPKETTKSESGGSESSSKSSSTSSSGSSTKDGTGTGKGDTGTGAGADKGKDDDSGKKDGGVGEGEFDGSGDGIFGRKVIYRNYKNIPMHTSGRIVFRVCINRGGAVTYVEIDNTQTTVKDRNTLKEALTAAKGYKFEQDPKAPREQCGILRFTINNNTFKD